MQSQSFALDYSIPLSERVAHILQGATDPYRFTVGDISVRVSFTDNAPRFAKPHEPLALPENKRLSRAKFDACCHARYNISTHT